MMPMVLRIVIDTVTSGSETKGKIIIRSIGRDVAHRRRHLARMPDAQVLDPQRGDQQVAAPEADEGAGDGRDVALGAPALARTGSSTPRA